MTRWIAVLLVAVGSRGGDAGVRAGSARRARARRRHHHSRRRHVLHGRQGHERTELRQLRPRRRASPSTSIATSGSKAKSAARSASRRTCSSAASTVESQDAAPAELQRQPRRLGAEPELGRAVRHGRRRRPEAVREGRLSASPDTETFLTGNVGGGVEVVRRPLGPARRLPVRRGPSRRTTRRPSSGRRRDTAIASTAA